MTTLNVPEIKFYEQAILALVPLSITNVNYRVILDADDNLNIIYWDSELLGEKPSIESILAKELEIRIDYIKPLLISGINKVCSSMIIEITSSVLNTPHVYKYTLEDQINLQSMVSSNVGGKLQVKEVGVDTVFKLKDHTAEQIIVLYEEANLNKISVLEHYRLVKDLINNATSIDELAAIAI